VFDIKENEFLVRNLLQLEKLEKIMTDITPKVINTVKRIDTNYSYSVFIH